MIRITIISSISVKPFSERMARVFMPTTSAPPRPRLTGAEGRVDGFPKRELNDEGASRSPPPRGVLGTTWGQRLRAGSRVDRLGARTRPRVVAAATLLVVGAVTRGETGVRILGDREHVARVRRGRDGVALTVSVDGE